MYKEIKDINKLMYVNGEWVEALSGKRKNVLNPATGEVVGSVPQSDRRDIATAIDSASVAFKKWSKTTALKRSNLLFKVYEKLVNSVEEMAFILTSEQGKPLEEAKSEILFAAEYFRWYSEEAKRNYGETIPASTPRKRLIVIRQPVGVTAAITPWNFPIQLIARKVAPALAAGCTVVVKPAENTPLTAVALFEVLDSVNFPKGAFL